MSKFGQHGHRCDWCGKIANNQTGEYQKPGRDGSVGYIHQPEWERFPGGDPAAMGIESDRDICEECAEDRCCFCGSDQLVQLRPAIPGPDGWGYRCKACGKTLSYFQPAEEVQ